MQVKDVWRSETTVSGVQCVMTAGMTWTLM